MNERNTIAVGDLFVPVVADFKLSYLVLVVDTDQIWVLGWSSTDGPTVWTVSGDYIFVSAWAPQYVRVQ